MFDVYMADRINKKTSPDYKQVIGYVKSDTAVEFKTLCASKQITISDALELAVLDWMEKNK